MVFATVGRDELSANLGKIWVEGFRKPSRSTFAAGSRLILSISYAIIVWSLTIVVCLVAVVTR
jgi:hypothetical protein